MRSIKFLLSWVWPHDIKTKCYWGLQQLCKSCRTCFKFYCMFHFTCDHSFTESYYHCWVMHSRLPCLHASCFEVFCRFEGRRRCVGNIGDRSLKLPATIIAHVRPVPALESWRLPGGPREAPPPPHPRGLIVVFGGRPQYNCEDPCLIVKREKTVHCHTQCALRTRIRVSIICWNIMHGISSQIFWKH